MKNFSFLILLCFIYACNTENNTLQASDKSNKGVDANKRAKDLINKNGATIETRFATPEGFVRTNANKNSINTFLRSLPLKQAGEPVLYYNGLPKQNKNVYAAVVDLPIGNKDLHQCADACMNLWGLYLYAQKRYNDIQFKFLGDNAWHNYGTWLGQRPSSNKLFFNYMQQVFSAANTRSLFGQTKPIAIQDATIGDILIVTGNPYGHAVMIVDECKNATTGKKLFMLAQSYMPAQETQILLNPTNAGLGVWYDFTNANGAIVTPEWDFTTFNCRRF
jgi:hypothetical protein